MGPAPCRGRLDVRRPLTSGEGDRSSGGLAFDGRNGQRNRGLVLMKWAVSEVRELATCRARVASACFPPTKWISGIIMRGLAGLAGLARQGLSLPEGKIAGSQPSAGVHFRTRQHACRLPPQENESESDPTRPPGGKKVPSSDFFGMRGGRGYYFFY